MRLFLLDRSKITHGPYDWKLVREFFAFGLIDGYLACEEGAERWTPVASLAKISGLPKSVTERVAQYLAFPSSTQLTELQREMLALVKAPPFIASVNRYIVHSLISRLVEDQKVAIDEKTLWRFSVERDLGWKLDPATPKQCDYLKTQGIKFSRSLTKGEASCMISSEPATDAQWRRLHFFRCPEIPFLAKREAMELIDTYLAKFPEAEAEYQRWKSESPKAVEAAPSRKPSFIRTIFSAFLK